MQQHISKNHPIILPKAWSVYQVQCFFTSQHIYIFSVESFAPVNNPKHTSLSTINIENDADIESLDFLLFILDEYEDHLNISLYSSLQQHLYAWLTHTKWAIHLTDIDLSMVSQQVVLPKKRTQEAIHYQPLLNAILAVFTTCYNRVQQDGPPSILRWACSYHFDIPSPCYRPL